MADDLTNDDYNRALIKWLEKNSPEMWHQVALQWNWDAGLSPLEWIITQPECDKGTALLIYWVGDPHSDLSKQVAEKYQSGFYKNEKIFFDPKNDQGTDWTKEFPEGKLITPTSGQPLSRFPLEQGYPQEVLDEVEKQNNG